MTTSGIRMFAAVLALGACRSPARPVPVRPGPVRSVEAVAIGAGEGGGVYRAAGTVQALQRATLATRMMARIETITVRVGDRVAAGRVVATFERGAVAATGSQADAALTLAAANLRRMERLYADSAVPIAQLEAARAQWQQAEGQRGVAAAELGYAALVAPFDGIVTGRYTDPGALAAPGQPIVQLEGTAGREILVGVPAPIADGLLVGRPVTVLVGPDERPISARLAAVVRSADPVTHTVTVRLTTDQPLTPNLAAVAEFPAPVAGDPVLRLPRTAILERGELSGVFLVTPDSTARLRWIRLGRALGLDREVIAGLRAGDVVVRRADQVADGDRVVAAPIAASSAR
jgi:RND family efflux transporter MFP subunit